MYMSHLLIIITYNVNYIKLSIISAILLIEYVSLVDFNLISVWSFKLNKSEFLYPESMLY